MILPTDIGQAISNLRAQKTRTLLTALGIVFGGGSVIGMLAIGAEAREESLRFIEQLGVRNILVDSRPTMSRDEFMQRRKSSQGLSDRDVRILQANIEAIDLVSPRKTMHPASVLPKPSLDLPELYGVAPAYSIIHSLHVVEGRFFDESDEAASRPVCVLGDTAKVSILGFGTAIGKYIKVNQNWLEVVGVLKEQLLTGSQNSGASMQDLNNIIFIPRSTFEYCFWDPMSSMRDELDGVEVRSRRCRQHRSGQGSGRRAEFDAS